MSLHLLDRVAVDDEGEGDPVVCVHGLGGSANTWEPLMPVLRRHRVLRVELPGSARSARVEGALSIARFVDCLMLVMERLGLKGAHFLGHSLGTIVCQHLAVQFPKSVRSLALFGPLLAPAQANRNALMQRAQRLRSEGAAGMHAVSLQLLQSALSRDTQERHPLAVALVRESLTRSDAEGYARTCEALAEAQPAAVETIRAPVLLVTGDEDAVAPPQGMREIAQRLHAAQQVRQVVLPRCGHWTPVERPTECGAQWRDFALGLARA